MVVAGFAFSGAVVAILVWVLGLRLVPDVHGRSMQAVRHGHRWLLFTATALVAGVGTVLVAGAVGNRPAVVAFAWFAAVSPGLAVIDGVLHRIPYVLSGALLVLAGVCFGWDALTFGDGGRVERAAWAVFAAGAFGGLLWLVLPGQLGPGDVALIAVIGGYAGWVSWPVVSTGLFLGFAAAIPPLWIGRWRAGSGRAYLPLGPFLMGGWWAAFALWAVGWISQPL